MYKKGLYIFKKTQLGLNVLLIVFLTSYDLPFVNNCGIFRSPYVCDGFFVFVVCRPYCNFISFGSDVNDGSTHIVTVVIKSFTNKTQELQEKQTLFPNALLLGSSY